MRTIKRRMALLLLLAALLTCTPVSAASKGYTDVPKAHWAYGSIQAATQKGLLQGVGAIGSGSDRRCRALLMLRRCAA